jgi:hypothetical protein
MVFAMYFYVAGNTQNKRLLRKGALSIYVRKL